MFIRETKKTSATGKRYCQYILVQAARVDGKSRQTNVLYLGSESILANTVIRTQIAKALEEKIYDTQYIDSSLSHFSKLDTQYQIWVTQWVKKYKEREAEKLEILSTPADPLTATFESVDTSSLETLNCREAGAEWMCLQMAYRLKIEDFFYSKGFSRITTQRAMLSIVSRAVFPASE